MAEMTEPAKTSKIRAKMDSPSVTKAVKKLFRWEVQKRHALQTLPHYREVVAAPPSYDSPASEVPFDGASSMYLHYLLS